MGLILRVTPNAPDESADTVYVRIPALGRGFSLRVIGRDRTDVAERDVRLHFAGAAPADVEIVRAEVLARAGFDPEEWMRCAPRTLRTIPA